MACRAPLSSGESLLQLGGAVLLADAFWGAIWLHLVSHGGRLQQSAIRSRLPYSGVNSPMTSILSGLRQGAADDGKAGCQGLAAVLGLAAGLSVLLGISAVLLSLLVVATSLVSRLRRPAGAEPAVSMALLNLGLPWLLGASLGAARASGFELGSMTAGLALGLAFTVLAWSISRGRVDNPTKPAHVVWFGQIVVLLTLIVIQEPVGLALAASFLCVPCLLLATRRHATKGAGFGTGDGNPWWLFAMLASALAVRL